VSASAAATIGQLTDDRGFFRQWSDIAHQRNVAVLYPNLDFDIEAVILAEPDLVVVSATGGDSILPYVTELRAQGLQVLVLDYSQSDWQQLARTLGRATGHETEAEAAIADFDAQLDLARAQLQIPDGTVSIVSYNMAGTFAVSKPSSAQARVLSALGFRVAGIPEAMRAQITRGADFDFVSRENLPAAITGDGVFLLNGTEAGVANFVADPVLANLPAIRAGRVWPLGPTSFRVDYYSGLEIIGTIAPFFRK
jgi:iron complex transport system substrate-binding protein